ncbi:GAF and ANTAR domain-containing protein [Virgisporangium aurantiacum]|uniref:GAF domain-containing protein n=1 Tax=Virgisporangium aurantiacum TaxID=175570 RepID=A0A8J3Z552_9ACTN|nr:GAF and ANTAR domain-containing protein [Virgisporangium aurantiacum]GIJ57047.1 GAF domain-containing protein [Virgisporangium aurantiacum]
MHASDHHDDPVARVRALMAAQPSGAEPGDEAGAEAGDGVVAELRRLCRAAVGALSASGAGLSVMAEDGVRGVTAASDAAAERLEELQFVFGEGPCIDAFEARRPVLVPDIMDSVVHRWPAYTPGMHELGVRAVFAFPLQVGAARLGVLDVFRIRHGPLTADELGQALTFADVAVSVLLDGQAVARPGAAAAGVAEAVEGRAELFQAQGMVTVQLRVPLAEALARIRAHAFAENRPLRDVARDIVGRRLRLDRDEPGAPPPPEVT